MRAVPVVSLACFAWISLHGALDASGEDDAGQMERWVADLASDDYQVRQQATRELRRAGSRALPALARGTSHSSLEARRRSSRLFFSALEQAAPELPNAGCSTPSDRPIRRPRRGPGRS